MMKSAIETPECRESLGTPTIINHQKRVFNYYWKFKEAKFLELAIVGLFGTIDKMMHCAIVKLSTYAAFGYTVNLSVIALAK